MNESQGHYYKITFYETRYIAYIASFILPNKTVVLDNCL